MIEKSKKTLIFFMVLSLATVGVAFAQMLKSGRSDVCGGSDLIHFKFADADKTEFEIPEPYLDRIMDMPHQGPYRTIAMRIKIDGLKANCENETEEGNKARSYIYITLKPYSPNYLGNLLDTQKFIHSQILENKDGFFVFASKNYEAEKKVSGKSELLVPLNVNLKDKYFLVCNWGYEGVRIVGCTVTQHITKGIYADYVIDQSQIKNLSELSSRIDEKVISFIK